MCLFVNVDSLSVKLLSHPGECVRALQSCTYSDCGILNLHNSLEPEQLKATLLFVCFISLNYGCGLMKG